MTTSLQGEIAKFCKLLQQFGYYESQKGSSAKPTSKAKPSTTGAPTSRKVSAAEQKKQIAWMFETSPENIRKFLLWLANNLDASNLITEKERKAFELLEKKNLVVHGEILQESVRRVRAVEREKETVANLQIEIKQLKNEIENAHHQILMAKTQKKLLSEKILDLERRTKALVETQLQTADSLQRTCVALKEKSQHIDNLLDSTCKKVGSMILLFEEKKSKDPF